MCGLRLNLAARFVNLATKIGSSYLFITYGAMKFVFWDWNGTIVNDAPACWMAFNDVLAKRGVVGVSFDHYQGRYRHPVREMYEEVGLDLAAHPYQEVADEWHEHYTHHAAEALLHHDALSALESLKARGSRQMVVSALPSDVLVRSVGRFGIGDFFEQITGVSDRFGHGKVAEAQDLARRLGARGPEITVIGDSSHDAEVARALSANCVLVARGAESRERLESNGFLVVDSFESL
jgi:phosphoglycolate phosphatase